MTLGSLVESTVNIDVIADAIQRVIEKLHPRGNVKRTSQSVFEANERQPSTVPPNIFPGHVEEVDTNPALSHTILFQYIGDPTLDLPVICHVDSARGIHASKCKRSVALTEDHGSVVCNAYSW